MRDYNHADVEKKWQQYWETNKTYKVDKAGKKKLYCLDMFPYPSGNGLHIGHPLGYTATDIYSRFFRMKGYSVLHPMGFDAFGLPTEQTAVRESKPPAQIAERNCGIFREQLKALGYCYDWDREIATCTPDYYKWTQWIFLQVYNCWFDPEQNKARPIAELPIPEEITNEGPLAVQKYQEQFRLAYLAEEFVNWCPELGSVLANEEVINGRSERGGYPVVKKSMRQWKLRITKYADRLLDDLNDLAWPENIKEQQRNWIGKRFGTEISFKVDGSSEKLDAFTTRPDTLFGVTFFVISPEHPIIEELTTAECKDRVASYCEEALKKTDLDRTMDNKKKTGVPIGSFVINPITEELVPVYVGDYVLMSYGTGAVMGVPSHDDRDFEFARTFNLPVRPVLAPAADKVERAVREAIVQGDVAYTAPGLMLPSNFAVAKDLALEGKTNVEAKELITAWLEGASSGRRVVNYKLRDWLFSRQRYWGEPIPIVHWEDGQVSALDESELPLVLPQVDDFKPSADGESPLAKAQEWLLVTDKNGRKGRRETNTMPNWAGSCWYYLRFIDPKNDKKLIDPVKDKEWMSVDLYVGGAEHAVLHLLYARFWHKILFDLGHVSTVEPFKRLINQGMILAHAYKNNDGVLIPVDQVNVDGSGNATHKETGEALEQIMAKMSKSLKNVVNPDDIIKDFGADTLRLYIMFMGPLEGTRIWDSNAITGTNRFLRKAWRFVINAGEKESCTLVADDKQEPKEVTQQLHLLIKKVSEGLEAAVFNTPIAAMMEFLNFAGNKEVNSVTLITFAKLIAPFAPHMAEEMWEHLGQEGTVSLAPWPSYDESLLTNDTVAVVVQVNGKKRALIDVDVAIDESSLKQSVVSELESTNYAVADSDKIIFVWDKKKSQPKLVNVIKSN